MDDEIQQAIDQARNAAGVSSVPLEDPIRILLLEPLCDHVMLLFLILLTVQQAVEAQQEMSDADLVLAPLTQGAEQLSRLMDAYRIRGEVRNRMENKDSRLLPAFDALLAPVKEKG